MCHRNEGKVLTHQYLLRAIWGPGYINQSQYLRVFIAQIRKKIEEDPNRPEYLLTESGVGYRFLIQSLYNLFMKVINIIFIILFIIAAALQYNDPDPYIWIPLYLYGALLCYLALIKRFKLIYYMAGFLVYGVYAIYLFFTKDGVLSWLEDHGADNIAQTMKVTEPWIEATREFFGLLILILIMIANVIWANKNERRTNYNKNSTQS